MTTTSDSIAVSSNAIVTAPPPAPHQTSAYLAQMLLAKVGSIVGTMFVVLSAISPWISPLLAQHAALGMVFGTVVAGLGQLQATLAHSSYQSATSN